MPLEIPLADLRRLLDTVLRHVEATAGEIVPVDRDYFWSIPHGELYDVYNQPAGLTIGQLTEIWQNLSPPLADEDRALGYDLVWLADILRAIGHSHGG